jgi:phosphoserine phosphatase
MRIALTLVSPDPEAVDAARSLVEQAVHEAGGHIHETAYLGPNCIDKAVEGAAVPILRAAAEGAIGALPVDVCVQPAEGRRKKLLIADMDSTIIGCECLDELADFAGVKEQVAAITERAMRGELQFEGALRERVGMLKGLGLDALQNCYDERVRLNPGARTLAATMAAHGARTVLVSGGFEFFTGRVADAAGFQAHQANRFVENGDALAGTVVEPILGREAKLEALEREAAALGIAVSDVLAVGDGANDLMMIKAAGLGVAYRAKPVVAAEADARVDHSDLTALLYFQGYRAEDFDKG